MLMIITMYANVSRPFDVTYVYDDVTYVYDDVTYAMLMIITMYANVSRPFPPCEYVSFD